MQKIGKPSRQEISGEVSGWAREVFKQTRVHLGEDIEVGGRVYCSAER